VWFRDGQYVVSAGQVGPSGRKLTDVQLFKVNDQGLLVEVLSGRIMVFREGVWRLVEPTRVNMSDLALAPIPSQKLPLGFGPSVMADLGRSPEGMGLVRLWNYVESLRQQGRPADSLAFALWHRITLPLTCVVMVLVAAPFVSLTPRTGGRVGRLLAGIGVGMAFHFSNVLVERLTIAGGLPPIMAAWLPVAGFTALGGLLFWRMR
jgi:lipopolysaccharide export system permease protein